MGVTHRGMPWVIALGLIAGCETFGSAKVENPVLGPAPPRVASQEKLKQNPYRASDSPSSRDVLDAGFTRDDAESIATADAVDRDSKSESDILLVNNETHGDGIDLSHTYVVASVNGLPIFANDVLLPYAPKLKQLAAKFPEEKIAEAREYYIKKDLPKHVEKMILISALNEYLKPDQKASFDAYLDQEFEAQLKKIQKELHVETKQDLELVLTKTGTTLEKLKEQFREQQMVMHYMSMKSQSPKTIGRQDLLNYYQSHREEYAVPSRVKWQVIIVPFSTSLEKKEARGKAQQALDELVQGTPFEQVAKKYSSGPTAAKGGHWNDWTTKGSLADEKLEQLLYEIPIGEISAPYESDGDFRIVRVIDRNEAGYRSFEELQSDIEKTLNQQKDKETRDKVIRELRQNAYIETIYDKPGQPYMKMLLPEEGE
ncbi:MAG: peptidylprolyl isomerase [Planctomycetaceae bacterium]